MSSMPEPNSVFFRQGSYILPTELARGPWTAEAQHGGAPAGLLAAFAEQELGGEGWFLARITIELLRPVPLAPLGVVVEAERGKSVRRASLALDHAGVVVARAAALLVRETEIAVQAGQRPPPFPPPDQCPEPVRIPGMPPVVSFHYSAMEARLAAGSVSMPGPAGAWLRLRVPLLDGTATTPVTRAAAAADFGNGISWSVPLDRFVFANTDLTVYLSRPPQSEWIGLDSETRVEPNGLGLTASVLYDEQGQIGLAQQTLLIRLRRRE